jgi:DNA-binding MarR family transcriptional regulator
MTAPERVSAVRRFNRFYTSRIGVLDEGLLDSPFSLTEARVLYELAHRPTATAAELLRELGLDRGYLSRILSRFEERGLLARRRAADDNRRSVLRLTRRGLRAFAALDAQTNAQIEEMLAALSPAQQDRLLAALRTVETLLDGVTASTAPASAGRARRRRRADAVRAPTA